MDTNSKRSLTRRNFITLAGLGLLSLASAPKLALGEENVGGSFALVDDEAGGEVSSAAEETLVGAQNELGEYSYIPGDSMGEDTPDGEESVALALSDDVAITEIKGATRYETAAQEALAAYSSSEYLLVASGTSYADSIAATGLAGALGCPIVLTDCGSIPSATSEVISKLGVSKVIILGGEAVISSSTARAFASLAGSVLRLAGPTRYGTQMEIWNYGNQNNLWASDVAYIALGENFADALSASPLCFAQNAPVFFTDGTKGLPSEQLAAISSASKLKNFVALGGEVCVSSQTYDQLASLAAKRGGSITRLYGETRYETSAEVGKYAVQNLGFSWDGVAFTSGQLPFDALAGAPMQGRIKAPLLLADSVSTSSAWAAKGGVQSALTFLGGYSAIPVSVRSNVCETLGYSFYSNVSVTSYDVSLTTMSQLEEETDKNYGKVTASEFYSMLEPGNFTYGSKEFLQFAVLNAGYSGLSASALNDYVSRNCSYSESHYGRQSVLKSNGAAFVAAAKSTGVNEAYLLAHSIWETGWGCSQLASGWTADKDYAWTVGSKTYTAKQGTTYYNLYGIGAYDSSPLEGGYAIAVEQGWTSVEKAVLGAANWIKNNYHGRSAGRQNTLYLMKFDLPDAQKSNRSVWHQYCTGGNTWVLGISRVLANCYTNAGYALADIPLTFDVPSYSGV